MSRPDILEVNPTATDITSIGGGITYSFVHPESSPIINVRRFLLAGEAIVGISESDPGTEINFHLSTTPHLANPDLVRASTFYSNGGTVTGRERNAVLLPNTDSLVRVYHKRHARKLTRIEGIAHTFVIGQEPEEVFIDGWIGEAISPSWRLTLPLEGDDYSPRILVPQSRLLIFR